MNIMNWWKEIKRARKLTTTLKKEKEIMNSSELEIDNIKEKIEYLNYVRESHLKRAEQLKEDIKQIKNKLKEVVNHVQENVK